jgi:hypothetical protein
MEQIAEAAAKAEELIDREAAGDPSIRVMTKIVEKFLRTHRVMCYGGTALNNLLPPEDQFYDKDVDIPDYDFFTETPQLHAMQLADMYAAAGYTNVEVKPGVHLKTFKVFVNFTGMADLTFLHPPIFKQLWDEDYVRGGIHYVSPDYLRMSVYLELSRPRGMVSRWVKIYTRLMLLNKHYPVGCKDPEPEIEEYLDDDTRYALEGYLAKSDVILMGMHAVSLHTRTRADDSKWRLPLDLLVNADQMDKTLSRLTAIFGEKTNVKHHAPYAEILPAHSDICDKRGNVLVRVFETVACHSYHQLKDGVKVASIPTLLQFFFAFLYADTHDLDGYNPSRVLCVAQRLVDMANHDRKRRYELLTPLDCLGHQTTLNDIREEKSELYQQIPRKSPEFFRLFFTYNPVTDTPEKKRLLRRLTRKLRAEKIVQNPKAKRTTTRSRRR